MKKILLLLFFLSSEFSFAVSGNELKEMCSKANAKGERWDAVSFSGCIHYIDGVMEASSLIYYSDITKDKLYCIPNGVTRGQGMSIVEKYLEDNPSLLHNSGAELVISAFIDAFPCVVK